LNIKLLVNPFLCTIDEAGRLKPLLVAPKPSFSCPSILIDRIEILTVSVGVGGAILIDFSIWGSVSGGRYDYMAEGSGEPVSVRVYVNGADHPVAEAPITIRRELLNNWKRPYSYDGEYAFTLRGIEACEGLNTLELRSCDSLTQLDSGAMASVSFALDVPTDWDGEDFSCLSARVESAPEIIQQSADGEYELYTIAIADVPASEESLTISFISEDGVVMEMPTAIDPVSGWHYICVENTNFPLMFSFLVGVDYDLRAGGELKSKKLLKKQPRIAQLSPDNQFRVGFSLGMAHSCMDLYFSKSAVIAKAVHYDPKLGGLKMSVNLNHGSTKEIRMDVCFPATLENEKFEEAATFGICELMLYCMKLYLSGDPRKDEFVIALLTDSWEGMGLAGYEFNDCRDCLGHYGAEILESLCESFLTENSVDQGLYLGQGISEVLRVIRAGSKKVGINEYYTKAQFLTDLG